MTIATKPLFDVEYSNVSKTYSLDKEILKEFDYFTEANGLKKTKVISDLFKRLPLDLESQEKIKTAFESKTNKTKRTLTASADALQNMESYADLHKYSKSGIVEKLLTLFLIEKGVRTA